MGNTIDVTGRVVEEAGFSATAGNMSRYAMNKPATLKAGIYFITLDLNSQKLPGN